MFTTFADVMAHLDQLGMFHMDYRLCRMKHALAALKLTGTGALLKSPVVQIVGTNGKGSTATFLAAIAQAHKYKVGLYTSPHLAYINERIQIDGKSLSNDLWPDLANQIYAAAPELTYFEFLTVLAVLAFVQADVDLMILEAGLGGHYDATTAVKADIVCFTPIALDHVRVLGPTVTAIASDKAHAMRFGKPAITAPQHADAQTCLQAMAQERHCSLQDCKNELRWIAEGVCTKQIRLGLSGPHQQVNAALGLAAWRTLARLQGWESMPKFEIAGLAAAFIPGRLQFIPRQNSLPPLLLDGSHNPHGFMSLVHAVAVGNIHPRAVIFTCLADKDDQLIELVRKLAGPVPVLVPELPGNERARSALTLAARIGENARAYPRLEAALAAAAGLPATDAQDPVVICGSLYLLGKFYQLHPEFLEHPQHEDEPQIPG